MAGARRDGGGPAVNILDKDQHGLCLAFARSGAGKFAGVGWRPAATGSPVLDGALAWIGATVTAVHDGGNHDIVVGRVEELGTSVNVETSGPLIFYRSAFDRLAAAGTLPDHRARQQPRASGRHQGSSHGGMGDLAGSQPDEHRRAR